MSACCPLDAHTQFTGDIVFTQPLLKLGAHISFSGLMQSLFTTLLHAKHSHPASPPCRDPYVTGTSVLGIVYQDGVMLAADTLGGFTLWNPANIPHLA